MHPCQPESHFNKLAGLRSATLLKKRLALVFSSEFCKIFKNTVFKEYRLLPLIATVSQSRKERNGVILLLLFVAYSQ